ncbi:putative oxidoreductase - protein [Phaeoacremonium minimum UCRPA7]|uniref:Putative oxidoreductase-protein n=1 Tax=Phaeoacremonium minimum (strain UCR-PA7) TaxID=1286976 RepID=R8BX01_PHAM7|nr:putative oxidoreductase - protein [Phaeoacremonium minimum UCRPA7]EOO03911.1 putative oxidoreductase - protein [Phaeoacremonium minimum UCRPA7]
MQNRIDRVAIIGAGGHIGSAMAKELLKIGKTVTGLTRAASTSNLPSGVKAIVIDYDDESSLIKALEGQDFLIISLAIRAPAETHSKIVRAAAKAGIQYIMPNVYGYDFWGNEKLGNDTTLGPQFGVYWEDVKKAGIHSVVLTCGYWYEWSLGLGEDLFGFDIKKRSGVLLDGGNVKINTSTWAQCGRAVAALLNLPILQQDQSDTSATISRYFDNMLFISSFRVSQRDMYESLKRVTGTTDADWNIREDNAERRWKEASERVAKGDFSAHPMRIYSRIFFDNGDGDYETSHGLDNDVLGLPREDLDAATRETIRMLENNELPVH